ncbi:hypothetical protein G6F57_017624 [Rhizopus arrhizus]|nr:hypothetical protein G6F57_017624 [Rhizopus arrhizus]
MLWPAGLPTHFSSIPPLARPFNKKGLSSRYGEGLPASGRHYRLPGVLDAAVHIRAVEAERRVVAVGQHAEGGVLQVFGAVRVLVQQVVRAHGQGPVAARLVAGRGIHHPGVAIGLVAQRGGRIAHREFAVAGGGQAQFPVVRTPGAAQDRLVARVAVLDAADFIAADQRLGQAQRTEYRRGAADATHFGVVVAVGRG